MGFRKHWKTSIAQFALLHTVLQARESKDPDSWKRQHREPTPSAPMSCSSLEPANNLRVGGWLLFCRARCIQGTSPMQSTVGIPQPALHLFAVTLYQLQPVMLFFCCGLLFIPIQSGSCALSELQPLGLAPSCYSRAAPAA